jgi:AcrR family transcriptional regulator
MVVAVSRQGYEAVTVAELVAVAGVSKTAFYRQFGNKEACFLATYEEIVEQSAVLIEAAYRTGRGYREGMEAAYERFVEIVLEQPATGHLVFVDSLSVGAAAVPLRERTASRYEAMIRQSFAAAGLPGEVSPLVVRAIFGGIVDFAYRCFWEDEPGRLREHGSELVEWAVGYRLAAAAGAGVGAGLADAASRARDEEARDSADSGDSTLSWEEPANSPASCERLDQRERILRGTAQAVADKGYGALTVAAISAAAGTSNQTFYEYFASKEKAFLAAFDALVLQAYAVTGEPFAARDDWMEAGSAGMLALLEFSAENRLFRQLNFFELHAAGPIARDRAETIRNLFVGFMQPDPLPPQAKQRPPMVVIKAIAGGIWAVIQHEISEGRSDSLADLLPGILDLVLVPFGVEETPNG